MAPSTNAKVRRHALDGHKGAINTLYSVETGVLSGSEDGSVRLWDERRERSVRMLRCGDPVTCVAASGTGGGDGPSEDEEGASDEYLVHVTAGESLLCFDLRQESILLARASFEWGEQQPVEQSCGELNSLSVFGRTVVVGSDSGEALVFSLSSNESTYGRVLRRHVVHDNLCNRVALVPSLREGDTDGVLGGCALVSGGMDNTVALWREQSDDTSRLDLTKRLACNDTFASSWSLSPPMVHALDVSPDYVAVGLGNCKIGLIAHNLLDDDDDEEEEEEEEEGGVARTPAGEVLFEPTAALAGHGDFVSSIVFHENDPSLLVSGGNDSRICLWSLDGTLYESTTQSAPPVGTGESNGEALIKPTNVWAHTCRVQALAVNVSRDTLWVGGVDSDDVTVYHGVFV